MMTSDLLRKAAMVASLLAWPGMFCSHAGAASGDVDLSFDPGSGLDGAVNAVVVQPDGKILVGGAFSTAHGFASSLVARFHPDGRGDASFQAAPPVDAGGNATWGSVSALALQPDGKVLAGHFAGMHRLNADGSLDATFSVEIGAWWEEGSVSAVLVQPDGKVLIAGAFTEVNGTSRNGLARLNADGSVDRSFYYGATNVGANALALQPDGKIMVMGFTTIVRLHGDGTLDAGFVADEEISGPLKMARRLDGKILVAGYFKSGGYGIVLLHEDGSLDGGFKPGLPPYEGYPNLESLVVQPDGKVLVTGPFTVVDGVARHQIVRLDADGSVDLGFDPGSGAGGGVLAVALQPDGGILLSSTSTAINNAVRYHLVRLRGDGSPDGSFQPSAKIDGRVVTIMVQPDGKLIIGGSFTSVGGRPRPGIARLHGDGRLDPSFVPGIEFDATSSGIRSVTPQSNGRVLVTGYFATREGGVLRYRNVAWLHADGSLERAFEPDLASFVSTDACPPGYWYCENYATVDQVWPQPDGRIIVGGAGVTIAVGDEAYDYFSRPFLARFHPDGSLDGTFRFGAEFAGEASVGRMVRQPDGKWLAVGNFTVNGTHRGMTRLHADGSLDPTFDPGIGILGSYVHTMALQSDGRVVIGGLSTWIFRDTERREHSMVRLNADGGVDGSFHPPAGEHDSVQSLVLQPDGKIIIAGVLYSLNGSSTPVVARLHADGSPDADFHPPVANGLIAATFLQPDGRLLLGGDFVTVGGEVRPQVARLDGDSPMPALDIVLANGSAVLTWAAEASNVRLEETSDFTRLDAWSPVPHPAALKGARFETTVPVAGPRRFFRLASP